MIYICIPVHNRILYTLACIDSILNQNYKHYKIVICDDGSDDNTYEIIKTKYPEISILRGDGNLYWTGSTNLCVKFVLEQANEEDFIYTLNNDTELYPDTLENLVQCSLLNKESIIGSGNVFYNDFSKIEPSAFIFRWGFLRRLNSWGDDIGKFKNRVIKVAALSGKGVLIPIKIFHTIGIYEQNLLPHYHADTEFTFRAFKSGYSIYVDYESILKSHQHLSGLGSRTSKPIFKHFIKSFSAIKSPHHFSSLRNWNKLIHPQFSWFFLIILFLGIILGYIKRSISELFSAL